MGSILGIAAAIAFIATGIEYMGAARAFQAALIRSHQLPPVRNPLDPGVWSRDVKNMGMIFRPNADPDAEQARRRIVRAAAIWALLMVVTMIGAIVLVLVQGPIG